MTTAPTKSPGAPATRADRAGTLYVDLEGALLRTDLLWESVCHLVRERPLDALRLPSWLLGGRSTVARRLADRVAIDPAILPYRPAVLEFLERERREGRRIVLVATSDGRLARAIADHLGLFAAVRALEDGGGAADSAARDPGRAVGARDGDEWLARSGAVLGVWPVGSGAASGAHVAARRTPPARTLGSVRVDGRELVRALRPRQWVKNVLLFVPLLLAYEYGVLARVFATGVAFVCFCACASATYVVNDLLDVDADRRHPRKRERPFASGTVPVPWGLVCAAVLLLAAFALALAVLPPLFAGLLGVYVVLSTAYSLHFKERLFLDVLLLAGLYSHRVLAGAVAAEVWLSPWLLAFSMFFFLSLAFVKRYAELLAARADPGNSLHRRDYRPDDLGLVESTGLASGYLSVLVIGLYISSPDVQRLYPTPELLWLVCPILLYWITRVWFLARRGVLDDDPVLFATRDRASYVAGLLIALVALLAHW